MAERERTIQLTRPDAPVGPKVYPKVRMRPGGLMLMMDPRADRIGSFFLPDSVSGSYRPDTGVVIAKGEGVDIELGTHMGAMPYDGVWLSGVRIGEWSTDREVRVYGSHVSDIGEPFDIPWFESVPCVVERNMEEVTIKAVEDRVIIRREALHQSKSGIELPDSLKYRDCIGRVQSVGSKVKMDIRAGDLAQYNPRAIKADFLFAGDENLIVVPESGILYVVEEAA